MKRDKMFPFSLLLYLTTKPRPFTKESRQAAGTATFYLFKELGNFLARCVFLCKGCTVTASLSPPYRTGESWPIQSVHIPRSAAARQSGRFSPV